MGVASGCGCTPGQDPDQITLPAPGFQAGWRDGTGAGVCKEVPGAGRVCSEQGGFVRSLASTWVVEAETKGGLGTSLHHTLLKLLNTGISHLPIVFH